MNNNTDLEKKLSELKLDLIDCDRRKTSVEIQIAYVEAKIAKRGIA
jgi:hypothetical protein